MSAGEQLDGLRQRQLRQQVVAARDNVERWVGPARRYRWQIRGCVIGCVVGGLGLVYCLIAAALSAWVDFGPTAVFATVIVAGVLFGCSLAGLLVVIDDAKIVVGSVKLSPTDRLRVARREFDEAYAAYLDTAPVNTADVYLQPRVGGKTT